MAGPRPKLAVWKFASCDGCQLSLLDCEDELLAIAGALEIAYFPEATSAEVEVTTPSASMVASMVARVPVDSTTFALTMSGPFDGVGRLSVT